MKIKFTISLSPKMASRWQKCLVDMNKVYPEKHYTIETLFAEMLVNDIECQEECCDFNLSPEKQKAEAKRHAADAKEWKEEEKRSSKIQEIPLPIKLVKRIMRAWKKEANNRKAMGQPELTAYDWLIDQLEGDCAMIEEWNPKIAA